MKLISFHVSDEMHDLSDFDFFIILNKKFPLKAPSAWPLPNQ